MHELSIAQGIVDIVRQYVPERQGPRVASVRVRVGRLSGVVPDSLEFCFGAIVAGTPYESARLRIEPVPTACECADCAARFETQDPVFLCPSCGSGNVRLVSGTELQVVDLELAEAPAEQP
jgi:hydrogenase nickel incorporation protein HypA/HybF